MPKVSVIIATYKREDELKRALDSLKDQQYENIEIVIVDDNANEEMNSKVNTIVKEFENCNPKLVVKHITNPVNKGSAETRNIGIRAAEGKYITFLDDDDMYMPAKIKRQVEFMEDGGYDYSITDLTLCNEKGNVIRTRVRNFIEEYSKDALIKYHLKHHITGTDAMMFTKKYLEEIGGFAPIDVGDEFYLMFRAIEDDGKFGYLPGSDIKAFIHTGEGGLSSGEGKINGENKLYEFKKNYFDRLDSKTTRYIKSRHYVVIAYAQLGRKKIIQAGMNVIKAFLCAPISCIKLILFEN